REKPEQRGLAEQTHLHQRVSEAMPRETLLLQRLVHGLAADQTSGDEAISELRAHPNPEGQGLCRIQPGRRIAVFLTLFSCPEACPTPGSPPTRMGRPEHPARGTAGPPRSAPPGA